MQNLTPPPPACPRCGYESAPAVQVLDFTPVPRKARYDGWTPDRQRAFIEALAETGSVTAACQRINMSTVGAYHLKRQRGADSFAHAWDAALAHGVQRLTDIAMDRAIEGVPVPVFHKGEQVGERRRYNDRLMMFMIKHHQAGTPGDGRTLRPGTKSWEAESIEGQREHAAAVLRIRERLTRARRLYLASIADNPKKRRAWQALVGPVDWNKARRLGRQDGEPFNDTIDFNNPEAGMPRMGGPDMLMTAEAGYLADLTGGPDALEPLRLKVRATWPPESNDDLSKNEQAAVADYREHLIGQGWTADEEGVLRPPGEGEGIDGNR